MIFEEISVFVSKVLFTVSGGSKGGAIGAEQPPPPNWILEKRNSNIHFVLKS